MGGWKCSGTKLAATKPAAVKPAAAAAGNADFSRPTPCDIQPTVAPAYPMYPYYEAFNKQSNK